VMRRVRFSIAGLMGAVVIAALSLTALRNGSRTCAGVTVIVTCAVLCLALVGAVSRRGIQRAWWLGYALCGWGYLVLAFWAWDHFSELPTMTLLEALGPTLGIPAKFFGGSRSGRGINLHFWRIAQCLWTFLAAVFGGLGAIIIATVPAGRPESPVVDEQLADRFHKEYWRRPAAFGIVGFGLVLGVALVGSRWSPGLWAGATFLLTCGLLGLAALGGLFGRGKRREIWLGAVLFGAGYMILIFGRSPVDRRWPIPPTDHFLAALRPGHRPIVIGFPITPVEIYSKTERILDELERPIPMRFPNDTPLEDVLKYIRQATSSKSYAGIPIYVDPFGLEEAEKSLTSTVRIECAKTPLKESLHLCLKQLDLAYSVRDGYLLISSGDAVLPVYDDPFLIVGHCLLALVAAGLGGVLAPLVSDRRIEPPGPTAVN
jgi:hypothetical protein